ncbi:C2 domain-containing protein [Schizophyllum commune]
MATDAVPPGVDPLRDAKAGNVPVHTFDADASPAEKGSDAGKARDKLKSVKDENKDEGVKEVSIDTGAGASKIVPTIKIEDHDSDKEATVVDPEEADTPKPPGDMPSGPAPEIPDWYIVGWRQMSHIDEVDPEDETQRDKSALAELVSEQYYGEWFHNAAIIIFAVFAAHFFARFGFGLGWQLILLSVCCTYYTTSIRRTRRRARDDIQRELTKTRLGSEHETADWINNFLDRFWLIYEPVLSQTIVSSVDQILSSNTPAFLDSLRLSQFTLGNKAPRIEAVRTFPRTEDDIIMMDWQFSFTPNDVEDLTKRQLQGKVNPKIVLTIRVGKGLATAGMPILVEDITFAGHMRIRMKLMSNFPHVQIVDLCFLEKPTIDYVLKPIGGETFGMDIANIPGLSSFIRDMTHATLGPMMYDPNVFTLNLEQLLSGAPLDTAIGVLQVTIESARGIKTSKIGGGTPDPFVSISISQRAELARTKYKRSTYNPTWMETKFILVNSLADQLTLSLYDYNDHRKHSHMGDASFELAKLQEDATLEGLSVPILKDGKDRGEMRFDLSFFPVIKPEEGQDEDVTDTKVGIVRLTIHQAKSLDKSKSLSGDINPMAKLFLNGDTRNAVFATKPFKHTNAPVWEAAHEFLCADKHNSVIAIKVIDDRDFLKDPVIGYMSIRLQDLLNSKNEVGRDWFNLSGCKTGKIRVSAEWKPLNMAGSLHGADQYMPPIGAVRLHIDRATDVKNVEATLGGKSDPYVRVQVNNVTKGRTEVINNNLNPVWDQIIYIPVHSLREALMLECMDYQHLTKDRSLGHVELRVADLAKESDNEEYPYESTGDRDVADPIKLDKGNNYKGHLHYRASFIPALKLKGIKFESRSGVSTGGGAGSDEDGGTVSDGGSSISSSDIEHQAIPDGITINVGKQAGRHKKNAKSTDTTRTAASVATQSTSRTNDVPPSPTSPTSPTAPSSPPPQQEESGVELPVDELLKRQSGIIVFNVIGGRLQKKARLEVLLDDGYWPAFSTQRATSTHAQWEYVGEGFVKELDFGQVWLRLNEADEGDKDDIIAQWKGDAKAFLQTTLEGPQDFTLKDQDDEKMSIVTIESRYVPVPVKLEPRESINNQGVLRVDLIAGHKIRAADRGGKSDPYAVFTLNGQKVFKSATKKKTLNPEWNENFMVQIPSRVAADFSVEVFDWNQIEQAKSLGEAKIDVSDLEPFEAAERTLPLVHDKHGEEGSIQVRLMFQPEIIVKSRKNTSTFSTAGRAMTQFGGLPVQAGKGVFHGVTGVFKGKGSKDDDSFEGDNLQAAAVPQDLPAGQTSQAINPGSVNGGSMNGSTTFPGSVESMPTNSGMGTLRVHVIDAKDLSGQDYKPYAVIRVGDKEVKTKHVGKTANPEWNEHFTFAAKPGLSKLHVWIHDHKTLGKDKLLAQGEIDLWRHLKTEGLSAAEVQVELQQGGGLMRFRLEFDSNLAPNRSSPSISNEGTQRTASFSSPSRFSFHARRKGNNDDSD